MSTWITPTSLTEEHIYIHTAVFVSSETQAKHLRACQFDHLVQVSQCLHSIHHLLTYRRNQSRSPSQTSLVIHEKRRPSRIAINIPTRQFQFLKHSIGTESKVEWSVSLPTILIHGWQRYSAQNNLYCNMTMIRYIFSFPPISCLAQEHLCQCLFVLHNALDGGTPVKSILSEYIMYISCSIIRHATW